MVPVGVGWSQFDVLGRYQPVDHGATETGAGELTQTDVDGPFHGVAEASLHALAGGQLGSQLHDTPAGNEITRAVMRAESPARSIPIVASIWPEHF